jgi:hypothetical protein
MLEWDKVVHKNNKVATGSAGGIQQLPEVPMEVDTPLEEKVTKISEAIQGFHTKIVDLEAHTTPSTPPEEREQWEKTTMTTMERLGVWMRNAQSYMKRVHKCGLNCWRMQSYKH